LPPTFRRTMLRDWFLKIFDQYINSLF
jgi:hypothetical protein